MLYICSTPTGFKELTDGNQAYVGEVCADLRGVLNCYDRIIVTGNLHPLCYDKGMTKYLYIRKIRVFDYPEFAQSLRDAIRANARAIAER